jgi:hypothetical protein
MLAARWWCVLVVGGLALAACKRSRGSDDPCAGGACNELQDCELGVCPDDDPFAGSTIAGHSPIAGTENENLQAECPFADGEVPPMEELLNDTSIPEFRRGRARRTNYSAGAEFLQDHQLHENLLQMQGRLFECLDVAACYSEEVLATGALDFEFELEPSGRVSAVSVQPSAELDQPLVRACARRSLYEAKFPTWRGGRMVVSYSVEISTSI